MIVNQDLYVKIILAWSILYSRILKVDTNAHRATIALENLRLQSNAQKAHTDKRKKLHSFLIAFHALMTHIIVKKAKLLVWNAAEALLGILWMAFKIVSALVNTDSGAFLTTSVSAFPAFMSLNWLQFRDVHQQMSKIVNLRFLKNALQVLILILKLKAAHWTLPARLPLNAMVKVLLKAIITMQLKSACARIKQVLKTTIVMPPAEIRHLKHISCLVDKYAYRQDQTENATTRPISVILFY